MERRKGTPRMLLSGAPPGGRRAGLARCPAGQRARSGQGTPYLTPDGGTAARAGRAVPRSSVSLLMPQELKIGLTGLPSVGKTRTLMKIVEKLEEKETIVGGMVTESIDPEGGGKRQGFK